jgi:hypothetical protein
MRAQLTITVDSGKWLIARAILRLPEVIEASKTGKIVLKGGTTVSCVAEELLGMKLRISGRVTERGTVGSFENGSSPHSVLVQQGKWQSIDDRFLDTVLALGPRDVVIIGANAIDREGNAAMMAASPGGGSVGPAVAALTTEGAHIIIAAGLEKLIPGRISELVGQVGRKSCDFSMGAAVGLIPLHGRTVTEIEAIETLGSLSRVMVIGRGGIGRAEGSTTLLIEGSEDSLENVINEVARVQEKHLSGDETSLKECTPGSPGCKSHCACVYAHISRMKTQWGGE